VTDPASLDRFRLSAFESLELEDGGDRARELCSALAAELRARRERQGGLEGVQALVDALNRLGHALTRQPRDDGWATWVQYTKGGYEAPLRSRGARRCRVDHGAVRRDAGCNRGPAPLGDDGEGGCPGQRLTSFYERGLALVDGDVAYGDLAEADRILYCLYELETGVSNGGFHTYVTNTEGARLRDASAFLERIGATEVAAIVAAVIEVLPPSSSGLTDAVWAALDASTERLSELDDRFYGTQESLAELALDFLDHASRRGRDLT
jgi:hypothetical protein